jgi:hypothetical protein
MPNGRRLRLLFSVGVALSFALAVQSARAVSFDDFIIEGPPITLSAFEAHGVQLTVRWNGPVGSATYVVTYVEWHGQYPDANPSVLASATLSGSVAHLSIPAPPPGAVTPGISLDARAIAIAGHVAGEQDSPERYFSFSPVVFSPDGGCSPYMVIDSRGSGESPGSISPPGAAFATELRLRHPGYRVDVVANPYPAVGLWGSVGDIINLVGAGIHIGPLGAYHASVVDGENWLSADISSEVQRCPETRIFLTGYSQGAQVTGDVFQRDVDAKEWWDIAGVVLFGDPYFNARDASADHGTYAQGIHGILGTRPPFAGDPEGGDERVESYCHAHDPVCQQPPNISTARAYGMTQHDNYGPAGTAAADDF